VCSKAEHSCSGVIVAEPQTLRKSENTSPKRTHRVAQSTAEFLFFLKDEQARISGFMHLKYSRRYLLQ